jgi:hypothetical protein
MNEDEIFAYPNPAKGKVTFLFNLTEASDVDIEIFDISGDKVAELRVPQLEKNKGVEWKCEEMAAGIYLIKAQIKGQNTVKALKIKKIAIIREK